MVITRATEYSIRAMLHLASKYPAPVITKTEICRDEEITPAFLAKIIQPLIKKGLVVSKRGVAGGFALAKPPSQITLLDVMHAVEEPLSLNVCLSSDQGCDRSPECPVHDIWTDVRNYIENKFGNKTLAELVEEKCRKVVA
ncbi:Rrf2 family transcriptional regulator [bacterium]|nr:MAG: Rrf2 family transcriptional regulator [bacterium]